MVKNILVVGVGGQGTLLTSRILGNLLMQEGYDVKLSEVHGMSQRGGSVVTHIRFGEKVFSPLVEIGQADVILAFEKMEALRWQHFLKKDGIMIVNTQEMEPMPVVIGAAAYPDHVVEQLEAEVKQVTALDALELAREAGNLKVVNTVLLGQLAKHMDIEKEKWIQIIRDTVPAKTADSNLNAFEKGYEI